MRNATQPRDHTGRFGTIACPPPPTPANLVPAFPASPAASPAAQDDIAHAWRLFQRHHPHPLPEIAVPCTSQGQAPQDTADTAFHDADGTTRQARIVDDPDGVRHSDILGCRWAIRTTGDGYVEYSPIDSPGLAFRVRGGITDAIAYINFQD